MFYSVRGGKWFCERWVNVYGISERNKSFYNLNAWLVENYSFTEGTFSTSSPSPPSPPPSPSSPPPPPSSVIYYSTHTRKNVIYLLNIWINKCNTNDGVICFIQELQQPLYILQAYCKLSPCCHGNIEKALTLLKYHKLFWTKYISKIHFRLNKFQVPFFCRWHMCINKTVGSHLK